MPILESIFWVVAVDERSRGNRLHEAAQSGRAVNLQSAVFTDIYKKGFRRSRYPIHRTDGHSRFLATWLYFSSESLRN